MVHAGTSHGMQQSEFTIKEFARLYDMVSTVTDTQDLTHSMLLGNLDRARHTDADEYTICFDGRPDHVLPCSHAFCEGCMASWRHERARPTCPLCRKPMGDRSEEYEKVDYPSSDDVSNYISEGVQRSGTMSR